MDQRFEGERETDKNAPCSTAPSGMPALPPRPIILTQKTTAAGGAEALSNNIDEWTFFAIVLGGKKNMKGMKRN